MINTLQQLKGKTKHEFYKNISNYYDNMNIRFDEDPSAKNEVFVKFIMRCYY